MLSLDLSLGLQKSSGSPTTLESLQSSLLGSTNSGIFDLTDGASPFSSASSSSTTLTSAGGANEPVDAGVLGLTFDALDYMTHSASNATWSIILSCIKDGASTSGFFFSESGGGSAGRYIDGNAGVHPDTMFVDDVAAGTYDALHDALNDSTEHALEIRGLDASAWGDLRMGRGGVSFVGTIRRAVFIDEADPADLAATRTLARTWVGE